MSLVATQSPLLARRGGRDLKRNIAKLPLMERTGWWFRSNGNVFELNHHPVCALQRLRTFLLDWRSHPS